MNMQQVVVDARQAAALTAADAVAELAPDVDVRIVLPGTTVTVP